MKREHITPLLSDSLLGSEGLDDDIHRGDLAVMEISPKRIQAAGPSSLLDRCVGLFLGNVVLNRITSGVRCGGAFQEAMQRW
jgi:hypothetical protein